MSMTPKKVQAIYFQDKRVASALQKSITEFLSVVQKEIVSRYLSPENTHRLRHGGQWEHPGLTLDLYSGSVVALIGNSTR